MKSFHGRSRLISRHTKLWAIPVVLVLLVAAYGTISYLIASGITKAERKEQVDHPTAYGRGFEEVEFVSRKGDVNLEGWWLPGDRGKPTLIFVHGIGSMRTGDNAMGLAARLVSHGYNVLLFDLRAHGSSGGDQISGGLYEQPDVLGAFDYLILRGICSERIGVLGFSMGAATAIMAVAQEPAIHAVVVDSTYSNASDLIAQETARKTIFPRWLVPVFIPTAKLTANQHYGIDVSSLVPEEAVKSLPYPILVIHGKEDSRIPFEHSVKVHEAAHPESSIWLVPDVGHVEAFVTYPEKYVERVAAYFNERLNIP